MGAEGRKPYHTINNSTGRTEGLNSGNEYALGATKKEASAGGNCDLEPESSVISVDAKL